MIEDFPTFDRPTNAISGHPSLGYWSGVTQLWTNSAVKIFTESVYLLVALHPTGRVYRYIQNGPDGIRESNTGKDDGQMT